MRNAHRFAVLALGTLLAVALTASAQVNGFSTHSFGGATIHGVPPSVTSFGFGGRAGFHGTPPSVTSLNFGRIPQGSPRFGFRGQPLMRRHRREFIAPFWGGYYPPYAYDYGYDDPGYYTDDSTGQYPGGPTVFDRNGAPPAPEPGYDYRAELTPAPSQESVTDQPSTVLIFKDGHKQEVKNYAIVGATLYDLTEGRTRKVQLAELDLPATVKQNDERGVTFDLPAGSKLN